MYGYNIYIHYSSLKSEFAVLYKVCWGGCHAASAKDLLNILNKPVPIVLLDPAEHCKRFPLWRIVLISDTL